MQPDYKLTAIHQPETELIGTGHKTFPPVVPSSEWIDAYTQRIADKVEAGSTGQPGLDPKGAAGKLKPQLQLIPPIANTETAKALKHGADRYGPWNWRTANVESMTYIGAIKRHIDAYLDGEDLDESGAHHLGHIAASCAILWDAAQHGTLVDNRPLAPKRPRPRHLRRW